VLVDSSNGNSSSSSNTHSHRQPPFSATFQAPGSTLLPLMLALQYSGACVDVLNGRATADISKHKSAGMTAADENAPVCWHSSSSSSSRSAGW
jgi:hypothetical protein